MFYIHQSVNLFTALLIKLSTVSYQPVIEHTSMYFPVHMYEDFCMDYSYNCYMVYAFLSLLITASLPSQIGCIYLYLHPGAHSNSYIIIFILIIVCLWFLPGIDNHCRSHNLCLLEVFSEATFLSHCSDTSALLVT